MDSNFAFAEENCILECGIEVRIQVCRKFLIYDEDVFYWDDTIHEKIEQSTRSRFVNPAHGIFCTPRKCSE